MTQPRRTRALPSYLGRRRRGVLVTDTAGQPMVKQWSGDDSDYLAGNGQFRRLPSGGITQSEAEGMFWPLAYPLHIRAITVTFDGGGAELVDGSTAYLPIPVDCEILAWRLFSPQTGDLVVDVELGGVDITDGHQPELANDDDASDNDLSDWDEVTLEADDVLAFIPRDVDGIEWAVLQLVVAILEA